MPEATDATSRESRTVAAAPKRKQELKQSLPFPSNRLSPVSLSSNPDDVMNANQEPTKQHSPHTAVACSIVDSSLGERSGVNDGNPSVSLALSFQSPIPSPLLHGIRLPIVLPSDGIAPHRHGELEEHESLRERKEKQAGFPLDALRLVCEQMGSVLERQDESFREADLRVRQQSSHSVPILDVDNKQENQIYHGELRAREHASSSLSLMLPCAHVYKEGGKGEEGEGEEEYHGQQQQHEKQQFMVGTTGASSVARQEISMVSSPQVHSATLYRPISTAPVSFYDMTCEEERVVLEQAQLKEYGEREQNQESYRGIFGKRDGQGDSQQQVITLHPTISASFLEGSPTMCPSLSPPASPLGITPVMSMTAPVICMESVPSVSISPLSRPLSAWIESPHSSYLPRRESLGYGGISTPSQTPHQQSGTEPSPRGGLPQLFSSPPNKCSCLEAPLVSHGWSFSGILDVSFNRTPRCSSTSNFSQRHHGCISKNLSSNSDVVFTCSVSNDSVASATQEQQDRRVGKSSPVTPVTSTLSAAAAAKEKKEDEEKARVAEGVAGREGTTLSPGGVPAVVSAITAQVPPVQIMRRPPTVPLRNPPQKSSQHGNDQSFSDEDPHRATLCGNDYSSNSCDDDDNDNSREKLMRTTYHHCRQRLFEPSHSLWRSSRRHGLRNAHKRMKRYDDEDNNIGNNNNNSNTEIWDLSSRLKELERIRVSNHEALEEREMQSLRSSELELFPLEGIVMERDVGAKNGTVSGSSHCMGQTETFLGLQKTHMHVSNGELINRDNDVDYIDDYDANNNNNNNEENSGEPPNTLDDTIQPSEVEKEEVSVKSRGKGKRSSKEKNRGNNVEEKKEENVGDSSSMGSTISVPFLVSAVNKKKQSDLSPKDSSNNIYCENNKEENEEGRKNNSFHEKDDDVKNTRATRAADPPPYTGNIEEEKIDNKEKGLDGNDETKEEDSLTMKANPMDSSLYSLCLGKHLRACKKTPNSTPRVLLKRTPRATTLSRQRTNLASWVRHIPLKQRKDAMKKFIRESNAFGKNGRAGVSPKKGRKTDGKDEVNNVVPHRRRKVVITRLPPSRGGEDGLTSHGGINSLAAASPTPTRSISATRSPSSSSTTTTTTTTTTTITITAAAAAAACMNTATYMRSSTTLLDRRGWNETQTQGTSPAQHVTITKQHGTTTTTAPNMAVVTSISSPSPPPPLLPPSSSSSYPVVAAATSNAHAERPSSLRAGKQDSLQAPTTVSRCTRSGNDHVGGVHSNNNNNNNNKTFRHVMFAQKSSLNASSILASAERKRIHENGSHVVGFVDTTEDYDPALTNGKGIHKATPQLVSCETSCGTNDSTTTPPTSTQSLKEKTSTHRCTVGIADVSHTPVMSRSSKIDMKKGQSPSCKTVTMRFVDPPTTCFPGPSIHDAPYSIDVSNTCGSTGGGGGVSLQPPHALEKHSLSRTTSASNPKQRNTTSTLMTGRSNNSTDTHNNSDVMLFSRSKPTHGTATTQSAPVLRSPQKITIGSTRGKFSSSSNNTNNNNYLTSTRQTFARVTSQYPYHGVKGHQGFMAPER